jgi:hypothetical protein
MKTILSVLIGLSVATGICAQVPVLNSFPSARATIYLDFDGQYVTGTSWNWSGPIDAQPSGLSTDAITEVFNRVSEDYRIFNVNITTDSTVYKSAPARQRMRVIVTPTYQWYGAAGGVSFVGSFTWGDDTPAWVFSGLLGYSSKKVAEAISHEGGHTLGLQHQSAYTNTCTKTEYNPGSGTGETSWAPIMGVGYYKNLTTWHYGTSTVGCSTYQDDLTIIAGSTNNFGYRTDDIGNTSMTATSEGFTTTGFSTTGLINTGADKDVFSFTLTSPTYVHLNAVPDNVGNVGFNNSGANLDIKLSLLNYKSDTIGQYNPATSLSAGVDSTLASGTYYVVVEGIANAYLADNESTGYYSLSASPITILPIRRLTLSGRVNAGVHNLNWVYETDEEVKQIEIQESKDGVNFEALTSTNAAGKNFSWKPVNSNLIYYRIRVITGDDKSFYSNIISLREQGDDNAPIRVMNSVIVNNIVVNSEKDCNFQLMDATGRLLQYGKLIAGTNRIDVTNSAQKGLLLFRIIDAQAGQTWKLIKQ